MVYDPEESLIGDALQRFQELWANNGDAISRQYTGTDALKVRFLVPTYPAILANPFWPRKEG